MHGREDPFYNAQRWLYFVGEVYIRGVEVLVFQPRN